MIYIREYVPHDLKFLPDLIADLGFPSTLEGMEKWMDPIEANPYYWTFVATIDDQMVGQACV